MDFDRIKEKLNILSDAAKYDVSCASSGSSRTNHNKGLGDARGMGICHTYTEDGRCVSLLKILLTNHCIFDCAYCTSRKSNDVQRAAFTVQEVVDLTMNFYRRNYIEGLFLSSGIFKDSDYTMERLVLIAKKLRTEHKFNGYIHLKAIPGASKELMNMAALYADRLSVNIELPTIEGLKKLAPDKNREDMERPMNDLKTGIQLYKEEKKLFKKAPLFAPAGQSTQMVIGASGESDMQILYTAKYFYHTYNLMRVYYSGYVPVADDSRLPSKNTPVPMVRENRLYQTDWLLRFYGFDVREIVNPDYPDLPLDTDPKLTWALRNPAFFPVDINTADLWMIYRVPGIGVSSAQKIVKARKFQSLRLEHLKAFGIALNRAQYFIRTADNYAFKKEVNPLAWKQLITSTYKGKYKNIQQQQLTLF
jgi:putative DNA modification/repair radical SAM protein